ncbi:MAG: siderophore-interacting protein [Pseudomonadota bacterium]
MSNEYDLSVVSNRPLTPYMRRVTLHGESLSTFPEGREGDYVKGRFGGPFRRVLRSFTVRTFDAASQQVVLDFVDHGDNGPASAWARSARPGAPLTLRGPGQVKRLAQNADWVLIAGDLSALPAIAANLELLSDRIPGHALIEVPSLDAALELTAPPGIEVEWIVNGDASKPNQRLVERLRQVPWQSGRASVWFAGEFDGMRAARHYLRDERGIDRREMYLSCYWKLGDTDEGMKRAKRADAQATQTA